MGGPRQSLCLRLSLFRFGFLGDKQEIPLNLQANSQVAINDVGQEFMQASLIEVPDNVIFQFALQLARHPERFEGAAIIR